MSAEDMRRLTIQQLDRLKDAGIQKLRNLRHNQSTVGKIDGSLVAMPGNSAESIGLMSCEINAELNAIERAVGIVNDTYRTLTSPAATPEDQQSEAKTKEMY